jgi:peptide/nickel transport system permease protein
MARFLARRAFSALAVVWIVVTAAFALMQALPGGPGALTEDPRVPVAQRARIRAALGLDSPLPARYLRFLSSAARGDWGVSFASQRPVRKLLAEATPPTLMLAGAALAMELLLGVPLGALAARRAGRFCDHAVRALSLLLWSLPSFWLGLLLLILFALRWPLFPAGGASSAAGVALSAPTGPIDLLRHLVLPAAALGLPAAAATARHVRALLREGADETFLLAARARGVGPTRLLARHLLLPASAPIVELAGLSAAALLSGALAVEVVFSRPGLGRLAYDALAARDYPVLLAVTTASAAAVVVASFLSDSTQAAIDPRHRRHLLDDDDAPAG